MEPEQKSAQVEAIFVPSGEQLSSNEVKPASCVEADKRSRRLPRLASQNKTRGTIKQPRAEDTSPVSRANLYSIFSANLVTPVSVVRR